LADGRTGKIRGSKKFDVNKPPRNFVRPSIRCGGGQNFTRLIYADLDAKRMGLNLLVSKRTGGRARTANYDVYTFLDAAVPGTGKKRQLQNRAPLLTRVNDGNSRVPVVAFRLLHSTSSLFKTKSQQ